MFYKIFGISVVALTSISFASLIQASPADIDEDGIPNAVEQTMYMSPHDPRDAAEDFDGDSWSNLSEYLAGTDLFDRYKNPHTVEFVHQKIFASDQMPFDQFGNHVSISGNTAVVGSRRKQGGAVYIYEKINNQWVETKRIEAPAGLEDFGLSVGLYGDTLIVGAPLSNVVVVYERLEGEHWILTNIIDSESFDSRFFGFRFDMDNDVLVVGAPGSASAFVYRKIDFGFWVLESPLWGLGAFGRSVAISGDTIFIGSPLAYGGRGLVSVFEERVERWYFTGEIKAPRPETREFGNSIAIEGDKAIIAAWLSNKPYSNGSAYFYRKQFGWGYEQTLEIFGEMENNIFPGSYRFGTRVSLEGNRAIVGAGSCCSGWWSQGAAFTYMFNGHSWENEFRLTANDGHLNDYFGEATALGGNTALIGAIHNENGESLSGAAYFFSLPPIGE